MRNVPTLVALASGLGAGLVLVSLEGCKSRVYNKTSSTGTATTADRMLLPQPSGKGDDWKNIRDLREADYSKYLSRMENGREAKDVNWYHDLPLGLQGLPYLVLKVASESYPDIWGDPAKGGIASVMGVGAHPLDYKTKSNNPKGAWLDWGTELKPPNQRHGLPYGFVSFPDVSGDPAGIDGTQNTFFACAACHTSRILTKIDGKPAIRYYMGGPNTEMEAQKFAGLIYKTTEKLTNIETEKDPTKIKPDLGEVAKFLWKLAFYNCDKYKPNMGPAGKAECNQEKRRILGLNFLNRMEEHFKKVTQEANSDYIEAASKDPSTEEAIIKSGIDQVITESAYEQLGGAPTSAQCGVKPADPKMIAPLKLVRSIVGSGFKVKIMMEQLGKSYPFRPAGQDAPGMTNKAMEPFFAEQQAKTPPHVWDKRSGQMDAFGLVQGVVYLNAMRPDLMMFRYLGPKVLDKFDNDFGKGGSGSQAVPQYDRDIAQKWAGNEQIQEKSACKDGEWNKNVGNWITNAAALSDIKSLYRSEDEFHANWDGNQGAGARVLASGLSSVGDPRKVFTEMHETQNAFINKLPAPPYPFEDAQSPEFYESAVRGQALFNADKACVSCHSVKNPEIYNVGTDMNRAMAVWAPEMRLSLISLVTAACQEGKDRAAGRPLFGKAQKAWLPNASKIDSNGNYWCELVDGQKPDGAKGYMDDVYRPLRPSQDSKSMPGYKADPMYGVWGDAPYLHNGSVPTLRELLMTKGERDEALKARGQENKFVRGNLAYDRENGGFMAVEPNPADYIALGAKEGVAVPYTSVHDTTLRGNSNSGHEYFHKDYEKGSDGITKGVSGTEFTEQEKKDMVNYLKLK